MLETPIEVATGRDFPQAREAVLAPGQEPLSIRTERNGVHPPFMLQAGTEQLAGRDIQKVCRLIGAGGRDGSSVRAEDGGEDAGLMSEPSQRLAGKDVPELNLSFRLARRIWWRVSAMRPSGLMATMPTSASCGISRRRDRALLIP